MYAIGYDIADETRRAQVRRSLRRCTPYWQQSFFLLDESEQDALELFGQLARIAEQGQDGLILADVEPESIGDGLKATGFARANGIFLLG